MKRLLFIVNDAAFFLSHWQQTQDRVKKAGYVIEVAAPDGVAAKAIRQAGYTVHALPLARDNRNPIAELLLLNAIRALIQRTKPDLVHMVTIKPVLWGGLICRMMGIPAVSYISGLGYVTLAPGRRGQLLRRLVRFLYPLALNGAKRRIIVENGDDHAQLRAWGVETADRTVLIRGSGIDLRRFKPVALRQSPLVALMPARLLADKGIREFIAAARLLADRDVPVRLIHAGALDLAYPNAIPMDEVETWRREGIVTFLGHIEDMAEALAKADVVVLPSYREGLPRALLEASASGRPIVTTDVPGCRDVVANGKTGLLVPARDPVALADSIERLVNAPRLRQKMGQASRAMAEADFDIEKIAAQHIQVYRDLLGPTPYQRLDKSV